MKKCKHCQSEIDDKAKVCPKCRKKQGKPIIRWIIIAIIVLMFGGCVLGSDSESSENKQTTFKVGETFESDYISLTMTSVDDNFTGYNEYADVKDGYKIIKANFAMESKDGDQVFMYTDFNCYADDTAYEQFYSVDDSGFSHTLSNGKKASGNVYCEVPSDAEKIIIEYDVNFWTEENIEFIIK